jgi:hypothetical protein
MKTVSVIEGFAGGPMLSKELRKALTTSGFKVIKNRRQADIIVAHSAGIYAIPETARARLLLLIGPTYWPGVPLLKRAASNAKTSKRYHVAQFGWFFYLRMKSLEVYYFFRRHKYLWLGVLNNNHLERLKVITEKPGRRSLIVRNHDDHFSGPELRQKLKAPQIKFIDLPGIHDDYATNPKPYIDLLLKEL